MVALLNTLVLLPSILMGIPFNPAKEKHAQKSELMDKLLIKISVFSLHHVKVIVSLAFVIFLIFFYFATKLEFKHDPLSWHPDDSFVKTSTKMVDEGLRGSVTIEVIIDTHKENGLYDSTLFKEN